MKGEFNMSSRPFLIFFIFCILLNKEFLIHKNYLKHAIVYLSISLLLDPDSDSGAQTLSAGARSETMIYQICYDGKRSWVANIKHGVFVPIILS